MKRSEIIVESQEPIANFKSPAKKEENQSKKAESYEENTEDISKIIIKKEESDLTSDLTDEIKTVLSSSVE
jgi:hypothetical protein